MSVEMELEQDAKPDHLEGGSAMDDGNHIDDPLIRYLDPELERAEFELSEFCT